jgi:hypothetical protein
MNASASSTSGCISRLLVAALLSSFGIAVFGQTASKVPANWTDDMPSVAKVEQQIQGTDPTDTLERQVAVFEYLQTYIRRIKETRDYKGPFTPAETQLMTDYAKAQYDLQQNYNKSHTQPEIAAFGQKEGQYSINNALDWIKQLQGNNSAVAYSNTEADLRGAQQRNNARIQKDLDQSGGGGLMGGMIAGGALDGDGNSPRSASSLSADQRRCLELGDSYMTCVGPGGMLGAIAGLLTAALPTGNTGPPPPPDTNGVVLVGLYHSRTDLAEIEMWSSGSATITKCGSLVDNLQPYTIHKSGGTIQITRPNEPNPIVLTLQPDGSMIGPGTIQMKGSIIIGYNNVTACTNRNGYVAGNCSTTSTPILQAKMDTCRLSQLSPQPLPPPTLVSTGAAVGPSPPNGFWITGDYASSNGMQLSFGTPNVTLDCGQAHVKVPYTVANTATQFVIQVQNGNSPFQLVVAPDNTLRGSGSVTINGKLVSSLNGSNVFYTPHSETCPIASFSPKGKKNTMVASNAPMPALPIATVPAAPARAAATATPAPAPAPIADALAGAGISNSSSAGKTQLRVLLSSNFTGTNPLAGQAVFVSREPMDQILRELGVAVPSNASPAQAMKALQTLCHTAQGCTPIMQKLPTYYVTTAKLDATGKATLNATAATGQYYFFAIVPSGGSSVVWDVAANLAAGDNSVTFSQTNAQPLP